MLEFSDIFAIKSLKNACQVMRLANEKTAKIIR
jgi:hypothetical protein